MKYRNIKKKRIGILGGTFDPVHLGHLILAEECAEQLKLDKVIFVPAYMPPHKKIEPGLSASDRLNMLRLALKGNEKFDICTYELEEKGTSYSIDTVKYLKQRYKNSKLFFLAGSDSVRTLSKWKDAEKLLRLVTFVIVSRPGWDSDISHINMKNMKRCKKITILAIEISSSMIRSRIWRKLQVNYFLPAPVALYIKNKGLYQ